jgi:anaerobic magnesium-protoporphyrin IX monomethyl ester cyclase
VTLPHVLLVNLPHPERLQRRWVASYQAPNFLVPPTELMGLDALLRARRLAEVTLVDAIAEDLATSGVVGMCGARPPDLVVALAGFGSLGADLDELAALKGAFPGARTAVFGHLPTSTPEPIARHPGVDLVVRGEPEETLVELCGALGSGDLALEEISGLAFMNGDQLVRTPERPRLKDLDALPFPDHTRISLRRYREPFLPGPIGAVTSARGCPYPCVFCVRAYGQEMAVRSVPSLVEEMRAQQRIGVRHVRFMDDTFTLDRKRILRLCEALIEADLGLTWSCLTRLDRVDDGLCRAMARSGCRRAYVGIESADDSQRDTMRKGLKTGPIEAGTSALRSAGIETSGFFVVGEDAEAVAEAHRSARLAVALGLDYVIATRLQIWPGTDLWSDEAGLDPSGLPTGRRLGAPGVSGFAAERALYRRFYSHPRTLARHLGRMVRHPRTTARTAAALVSWAASSATRDFI